MLFKGCGWIEVYRYAFQGVENTSWMTRRSSKCTRKEMMMIAADSPTWTATLTQSNEWQPPIIFPLIKTSSALESRRLVLRAFYREDEALIAAADISLLSPSAKHTFKSATSSTSSSMWVDSGQSERSGSTALRMSPLSFFLWPFQSTISCFTRIRMW